MIGMAGRMGGEIQTPAAPLHLNPAAMVWSHCSHGPHPSPWPSCPAPPSLSRLPHHRWSGYSPRLLCGLLHAAPFQNPPRPAQRNRYSPLSAVKNSQDKHGCTVKEIVVVVDLNISASLRVAGDACRDQMFTVTVDIAQTLMSLQWQTSYNICNRQPNIPRGQQWITAV